MRPRLAINPTTGDIYLRGYTGSSDLPGTGGGAQSAYGGGDDGFVARFSSDLTQLLGASYAGATLGDVAYGLAIDPGSGAVYIGGETSSGEVQTVSLFVWLYSQYCGANCSFFCSPDYCCSVTGYHVPAPRFPNTAGGVHPAFGGTLRQFVARFTADLSQMTQSTYLGGSSTEQNGYLAIHPFSGAVYLAAITQSPDYPVNSDAAQPAYGGGGDAVAAGLRLH